MQILRALVFGLVVSLSIAHAETSTPANEMLASTYRLRLKTKDGMYDVTGWGTAFGVKLENFGLTEPRYLLSAAHLVLGEDGKVTTGELRLELPVDGKKSWTHCTVVAVDRNRDLCLLKSSVNLPSLCQLEQQDQCKIGDSVTVIGCPRGVEPRVSVGKLVNKKPKVPGKVWEAEAKFDHGNSGGPVFSTALKQVIGVAVAGVPDYRGEMDPNIALFAPIDEIDRFLKSAMKKLGQGS